MTTQKIKAKDQRSHVLQRPTMYIGETKKETLADFVYDDESNKIVYKTVTYSRGLLKILDEALDNAKDNVPRSKGSKYECNKIKVDWKLLESDDESDDDDDDEKEMIHISNNGLIIPIKKHVREEDEPEDVDGVWEPQLVFGRLMAGSNFDDSGERVGAGSFGVGVSLLNIFSKKFMIEIHDIENQSKYTQEWNTNMSVVNKPQIKKCKVKENMVKVSFIPDYEKFGYTSGKPDNHIFSVFKKHVYDAAMLTKIKVYFNGKEIEIPTLYDYAELYFSEIKNYQLFTFKTTKFETSRCLIILNNENEIEENSKPMPIPFCNGCYNPELGTHYKEWTKAIFTPLTELCKKKYKCDTLTFDKVAKLFWIFIDAKLANPVFTSQIKVKVSAPEVPIILNEEDNKNIKKMMKWEGFDAIMDIMNREKIMKTLKKITSRTKNANVEGLEPANWAGGKKSLECTLIITEGLSAKTSAVKCIASDRDRFGVLPLRGKFLNVYKSTEDTIAKNQVIKNFVQALNLKFDLDYRDIKNRKTLNYGSIQIMTDSDVDGVHIEALIIAFFVTMTPTILQGDKPFLISQRTPIIRCRFNKNKKQIVKNYYSKNEFEADKESIPKNAVVKHFKGLGTLTDGDIKEIWNKKLIEYQYDDKTDDMVKLIFGKDTGERKKWLDTYDPLDTEGDLTNKLSEFLNKQMIKFSIEDCARSIPHVIDGFKEGQRKIIYTCFEKNLVHNEIKVAQLSGSVAEYTDYKHGENNLCETIINLAQKFVGSNNLTLLDDIGMFGSSFEGGNDNASPRYIFTKLKPIAKLIFRPEDRCILEHNIDEGKEVEFKYYIPILPYILFNGSNGIGSGYSCTIPNFNPFDIASIVKSWINYKIGKTEEFEYSEPIPWYRNFKGTIYKDKTRPNRYVTKGILEFIEDDVAEISCLPIGYWGKKCHQFLKDLEESKRIKKVDIYGCDNDLSFTIYENNKDDKNRFECSIESLHLITYLSTSNIVCFNEHGKLKKYTIKELIEEFCELRLRAYESRIKVMLPNLKSQLVVLKNKMRFINDVKNEKIDVFGIEKDEIEQKLSKMKYDKVEDTYNYLFDMKFYNITKSQLEKLSEKIEELEAEIKYLEETPITTIWIKEIDEFVKEYDNTELE